jgi:hypothetical protein
MNLFYKLHKKIGEIMHQLEYAIFMLGEVLEKNEKNDTLASIAKNLASESHKYIPETDDNNEKLSVTLKLEEMLD